MESFQVTLSSFSFLSCSVVWFFFLFFFFQLTTLVRSFSTCSLVYRQASSFISLFFLTSSACLSCQTNTVACLWIRWDWWGRNGKVKNALEKIRRWGRNQCSFLLQVSEGLPGLLGSVLNVNTDWSLIDRVTTGNLHTFFCCVRKFAAILTRLCPLTSISNMLRVMKNLVKKRCSV